MLLRTPKNKINFCDWYNCSLNDKLLSISTCILMLLLQMCIHKYKIFARFGLMHMIATNVCVWLRTVATETISDIHQHSSIYGGQYTISQGSNKTTPVPTTVASLPTPTPLSYLVVDLDLPNGSNSGNHGK